MIHLCRIQLFGCIWSSKKFDWRAKCSTKCLKEIFSWNSMIVCYFNAGEIDSACDLFNEMPERDLVSWNSMIDGLIKHRKCQLAQEFFDSMNHKDVISWTSMISGYVLNHRPKEAVDLFREMLNSGIQPDPAAIVSVLSAIADLGFVEEGVGSTIGAGVYVLVGTVAREHSGPALTISFLIAGIAAGLSAFCYAELASRCPSAGSAYHYSYICVGEGVAWLIGWALILEYTIGGAAVARGISPNLALLFGGEDSLPFFLSRMLIPGLNVVVDPCAAVLVLVVTGLLCVGIKESSFVQAIVTTANVCVMVFIIIVGGYLGFKTGWIGYELSSGHFPFGVNGMLVGSATVFFAYIGFDSVASTAEEVKNPQRDLPLGIGVALSICCSLYMLVSIVIVGLVPYYAMDPDTPISSAFASHGMQWAVYIITVGAARF